jgi:hypothetical protein
MLQNAGMVIIYIQNTVYVLHVCRLAPENGRDTEIIAQRKIGRNWTVRLSSEEFSFSTL